MRAVCVLALAAVALTGVAALPFGLDALSKPVPGMKTTFITVKEGRGSREVQKGDEITVMATGIIKEGNKKFWSTTDANEYPFTFEVGSGRVIDGWDKGVLGMREGELRVLNIPAAEAYGDKGDEDWKIPPGADLKFSIECQKIRANREGKGPTVH